jgi:hypothetical protein
VLTTRGDDFDLHIGQDMSIGYLSHTDSVVRLYLQETMTWRQFGRLNIQDGRELADDHHPSAAATARLAAPLAMRAMLSIETLRSDRSTELR